MINLLCSNKGRSEKGNSFVRNLFRFRTFLLRREKMGKTCVICGKPSGMYPLCKEHLEMKNRGEVVKCPDCGAWHLSKDKCKCATVEETKEEPVQPSEHNSDSELTCIICGQPSNGKHFCHSCWAKYKDKSIVLKITNCKETEVIESGYESKITCEDGHPVKSQQEAMIDDYLYRHNIKHTYEKPFSIDDNPEHDLHPDFYLPEEDVYIEHFGVSGNKKYEESKEYKLKIYKESGITLIATNGKDISNLSANLERKLKFFKKGEINFIDE